ncbi:MAG: L,D-transpeptidase family protein [Verrucomicrobiota bacterium]
MALLVGCSQKADTTTEIEAEPITPHESQAKMPAPVEPATKIEEPIASAPTEPVVPKPQIATLATELRKLCENPDQLPAPFPLVRSEVLDLVVTLYGQQEYQPFWFDGDTFKSSVARDAVSAFKIAESNALDVADYFPEALLDRLSYMEDVAKKDRIREGAITDLVFTLGVTAFAYDLHLGRVPHDEVVSTWGGVDKTLNAEDLFKRIRSGENVQNVLASFAPQQDAYRHLKRALATYREIAQVEGWQPIDAGLLNGIKDRELEAGSHVMVPLLRERLKREGYDVAMPVNPESVNVYDDSLKNMMQQFQANRGLEPDGIVGPLTVAALNIPVEDLIEKIVWSMDRWRWLPEQLGERHILVNVPEFKLRAYQAGQEPLQMRVIVGDSTKGTYTPLFADKMEYVIFRPYWNVPKSIIQGELVPEIKKDRKHIKKFNYEIVESFGPNAEVLKPSRQNIQRLEDGELKIRQTAGPYNALGLVKFIFPNEHSVYLHDTNQRNLFVYSKRDMSHGCIRVHDPEALARYALPPNYWTEERIREAMYGEESKRKSVSVGEHIPVYIFYLTAFPTAQAGPIGFFQDLYRKDVKMAAYAREPSEVTVQ